MDGPDLHRVLVSENCRVKGIYSDGSVTVLSGDCRRYIHVDPEGKASSHLTDCARRQHCRHLRQLLRFRNVHCSTSHYASWVMEDDIRERTVEASWLRNAVWSTTLQQAIQRGCLSETGGRVAVRSEDGGHCLVYDSIGGRLSVREAVEIQTPNGDKTTIIEEKVYPAEQCPVQWRPALKLAITAIPEHALDIENSDAMHKVERQASKGASSVDLLDCREAPWWLKHTSVLPMDVLIVMDWTPEVFYLFCASTGEVRAWIAKDGSLLSTRQEGKFLRHRLGCPLRERIYSTSSLPKCMNSEKGEVLYPLAPIAEHALLLRKTGCQSIKQPLTVNRAIASAEIQEEVIGSRGAFTAYQDGRIKVKCPDRTILNMNADGTECLAILPDGKRLVVSCNAPIGIESKVEAALDFRCWAFNTPNERRKTMEEIEKIEQQAIKCRLNAAMYRWMATKRTSALLPNNPEQHP